MIAVFGAGGFIGRNFLDELSSHGSIFKAFSRRPIPGYEDRTVTIDFQDPNTYQEHLQDVDHVVSFITGSVPGTNSDDLLAEVEINLLPHLKLLHLLDKYGVDKFLYLSSGGTVYGIPEQQLAISEDHPLRPISNYGCVKLMIETAICKEAHGADWKPIILRPSNPVGRYQVAGQQGLIATALHACVDGKKMQVWGDGCIVRDYFDVRDLASAIRLCLEVCNVEGVYNVSSGKGYSVNDVLDIVQSVVGRQMHIEYLDTRNIDVPVNILDNSKLKKSISWDLQFSLQDSIFQIQNCHRPSFQEN